MIPPRLSPLQSAWLQEIGLDKRMLARYAQEAPASIQDGAADAATPGKEAAAPAAPAAAATAVSAAMAAPAAIAPPAAIAAGPRTHTAGGAPAKAGSATAGHVPARAPGKAVAAGSLPMPADWEGLRAHIAACQACGLHIGRSQAVFGDGASEAPEWMVIGEAPGDYDDRAGLPFQGKAGVLLASMLAAAGVDAQAPVFFTNLMKCRPLGNRPPSDDEIAACLPYLQRQIAMLRPRRILTLGTLAARSLLNSGDDLDALRGRIHHVRSETGEDIPLVATYHPATLLLRPQYKAQAWEDLNLARSADGSPCG